MKANRERLYRHFVAIGYKSAAQDLLAKHPELAELDKPVEVEPNGKKQKR